MTAQCISTGKSSATAPLTASLEIPLADKSFFPRVQALMSLSIMLSSKRFATNRTHKWTLVCVRSQVRSQVVGAGKSLGTKCTLESSRVFLDSFCGARFRPTLILGIG